MELKEKFYVLKKRILIIMVITLILTSFVGVINYFILVPKYKAEISIMIGKTQGENANAGSNYYDVLLYQSMVKSYAILAKSMMVVEDVKEKLNLDNISLEELLSMTTVIPDKDTQFFKINVVSNDPKEAMNIVNQFGLSLKDISYKINKVDVVMIMNQAKEPKAQDSPKPLRNTALAFFVGLIFSIMLSFLLEYIDNTIKTKEEIIDIFGVNIIGTISYIKIKEKDMMLC